MEWDFSFFSIFTLVTGVVFLILEIRQSNWMWLFQFLSSAAALWVFATEGLWASSALNFYYVVMAFVGLRQWRRDALAVRTASGEAPAVGTTSEAVKVSAAGETQGEEPGGSSDAPKESDALHLRRLSLRTLLVSLAVLILGTAALYFLLQWLEDPKSIADAAATVLSAIATWWLAKSYPQQWLLWVIADAVSAYLCFAQSIAPMGLLYSIYALSAIYGYIHWKRKGNFIEI